MRKRIDSMILSKFVSIALINEGTRRWWTSNERSIPIAHKLLQCDIKILHVWAKTAIVGATCKFSWYLVSNHQ